jgi:hypothetical protein
MRAHRHRTKIIELGTIEDTAHHEAGHAVAAIAWVGQVHEVSIVPVEGVRAGICTTRSFGMLDQPNLLADQIEQAQERDDAAAMKVLQAMLLGHARYCFAGYCAEFIFSGRRVSVAGLSLDEVVEGFHRMCLAGYGEADDWEREVRRTRRFLQHHWPHVTAVADALLKHRTLDEEMFHEAIASLPPMRLPRYRS